MEKGRGRGRGGRGGSLHIPNNDIVFQKLLMMEVSYLSLYVFEQFPIFNLWVTPLWFSIDPSYLSPFPLPPPSISVYIIVCTSYHSSLSPSPPCQVRSSVKHVAVCPADARVPRWGGRGTSGGLPLCGGGARWKGVPQHGRDVLSQERRLDDGRSHEDQPGRSRCGDEPSGYV